MAAQGKVIQSRSHVILTLLKVGVKSARGILVNLSVPSFDVAFGESTLASFVEAALAQGGDNVDALPNAVRRHRASRPSPISAQEEECRQPVAL